MVEVVEGVAVEDAVGVEEVMVVVVAAAKEVVVVVVETALLAIELIKTSIKLSAEITIANVVMTRKWLEQLDRVESDQSRDSTVAVHTLNSISHKLPCYHNILMGILRCLQ